MISGQIWQYDEVGAMSEDHVPKDFIRPYACHQRLSIGFVSNFKNIFFTEKIIVPIHK